MRITPFLAALAGTTALLAPGALAQAPATTAGADEIIVTAQKRSQNIQDVPLAVTALSAEALQDKLVDDAADLQFSVPNLFFDGSRSTLRGIGDLAISSTSESGLGYHVDGVYQNASVPEAEYFDVARIEVLRGPQGTLYGRNTTAGVINIISRRPTDEFEGYVQATIGNYDTRKLKAAVNIPIADGLATRLAGFYLDRSGYTDNVFNGADIDDRNMYALRSSTRLDLGPNTQANLIVSVFDEDDKRANLTKGVCTKSASTGCSALSAGFETPDSRTTIFNLLGVVTGTLPAGVDYFAGAINPPDLRKVYQDQDPSYRAMEQTYTLELTHDFGDLTLTSLSSYQRVKRDVFNDFDRFVPTISLLRPVTYDAYGTGQLVTTTQIMSGRRDITKSRQFLQELRLASDFDGAFNFLIGANYYDYKTDLDVIITHPTLTARARAAGLSNAFSNFIIESHPSRAESYGVFGEVYVDLSERTRLTTGARYSNDRKSILTRQIFLDPIAGGAVRPFTAGKESWGVVTGRAVLDHKFSDQLLGYVSVSRGYKAGGLNPGGPSSGLSFDPEFLIAGEAGLKSTLFDGALRANLAAFFYDYDGLQIGQVGTTSAITVNTDARIYGAEAELAFQPTDALRFDVTGSLLNTEIKNFQSGDEGDPTAIAPGSVIVRTGAGAPLTTSSGIIIKNLDGNELPFSPNWKINIGAQYAFALNGGFTVTPRIDYAVQGEFFGTAFNKPSEQFDGYNQLDLKISLQPDSERWVVRAFVKNAQDNDDIVRITQDGPLVGRFRSVVALEPRTYGVELGVNF